MLGKCVRTGSDALESNICLVEYPHDTLKICTVFAQPVLMATDRYAFSENSILLRKDSVKTLINLLQEWLGEPFIAQVRVTLQEPDKKNKKEKSYGRKRTA